MCDFETQDMCGWINDPENDYSWVRRDGFNTFQHIVSGPSHDHTSGKPLQGYYMVAEQKTPTDGLRAQLLSPIYDKKLSENACLRLFYHMYGLTVGRLRVHAMPEDVVANSTQLVE